VIVGTPTKWPVIFALAILDRQVVDAGYAPRKRSQAESDFKKHMDYVFWVIMLLVGCGVIYRSVNCSTSFGLAIALRAARDGANVARSLRRPGANIRHFPARSTRRQVDELAIPEIPS
jgi:hypothetical protein